MAAIELTYFNFKGRAELLRFILSHAGASFTDNRIEPEKWAEKVPGVRFGIPVLKCDGQVLQANGTIAKFLAEKYNLSGCTDEEKKKTEEIIDITEEMWNKISSVFWEQDAAKKAEVMKDLSENYLPATLKRLEVTAASNASGSGWIVGQNVTSADFAITVILDALSKHKPELLQLFTALAKLKKSVEQLPNIERWIANRPETAH